ncbi:MAG: gamma-glutamyltransferase [Longimicrobiales bacterium]
MVRRLPLPALLADPGHLWVNVRGNLGGGFEGGRSRVGRRSAPRPGRPAIVGAGTGIAGPDGDAVSLTTTLNTWYGCKVVAEGTGVLLNNETDDFSARPGEPNHFGLVQGEANTIAPGKRMLSAMTPTLVLGPDGGLELVVGTPGARRSSPPSSRWSRTWSTTRCRSPTR